MSQCVIYNPNAGSSEQLEALREQLERRDDLELCQTMKEGDAHRLAAAAVERGAAHVIAAGGDGTVHEVVNGMLDSGKPAASTLAIIPLGTGNDLPRTLGVPDDPQAALQLIDTGRTQPLDAMRIEVGSHTTYAVNAITGGFSGELHERLTDDMKDRWGPLAYLRGALATLADLEHYQIDLTLDDKPPQLIYAVNFVVANGRFAGGGATVAPDADTDDGLLDIVWVVRADNAVEVMSIATRLIGDSLLESDLVESAKAKRIRIKSDPPMPVSIDGELQTVDEMTVSILPAALQVVVGDPPE